MFYIFHNVQCQEINSYLTPIHIFFFNLSASEVKATMQLIGVLLKEINVSREAMSWQ